MSGFKFTLITGLLIIGILCNRFAGAQTTTVPALPTRPHTEAAKGAPTESLDRPFRKDALREGSQGNASLHELNALKNQQQLLLIIMAAAMVMLIILALLLIRTQRLYRQTEQERLLLEGQAAELQAINANKDKLFSIVSHDLRTPVNNLHYLLQEIQQSDSQHWPVLLTQFTDRVGLLGRLINNLLYWSLAQQGLLRDREELIDLSEATTNCLALFGDAIQRKELAVRVSGPMPHIRADENQILVIIRNLVDNAVKFSPVGGQIQIQWTSGPTGLSLDVYNETTARSELSTGANLGLRVVTELVERQRGSMKTNLPGGPFWQVSVHWPADRITAEVDADEAI